MSPPAFLPRHDLGLLFLMLFVVASGNAALHSMLPAIGREIGMPDLLVGIIFSSSALLWTLATPHWAEASDRHGRKPLIMLGMFGYVASTSICALVVLAGLKGLIAPVLTFGLFAAGRALYGLLGSATSPAAHAFVAVRTPPAERARVLGLLASASGLGTVAGPAVAPFLVLPVVTLAGPLFVFAAVAVAMLHIIWRYLPSSCRGGHRASVLPGRGSAIAAGPLADTRLRRFAARQFSWRDPRIFPFVLYGLMIGNAQAISIQTLGFFVIDRTGLPPIEAQPFIGMVMVAGAGAALLVQWGMIPLFRMSPKLLLRWGAGLAAAGSIALALATDLFQIAVAFALAAAGYGFARPGFNAGASLAVGPRDQGAAAGAVIAVNGAAFVVAPAVGIALYQVARPLPYAVSAALLVAMLGYAIRSAQLSADLEAGAERAS